MTLSYIKDKAFGGIIQTSIRHPYFGRLFLKFIKIILAVFMTSTHFNLGGKNCLCPFILQRYKYNMVSEWILPEKFSTISYK